MATVAPWSAATARSVSAKATSGWKDADLGAGAHRRRQDLRPQGAAGVDHRLAAVHPEGGSQRGDGVVRDGQDDQLDLVEDGLRIGKDAGHLDQRAEALPAAGVAAGHGLDRPAGAAQGDSERGPDRTGPDDPDDRRLAGSGVGVRVDVVARMGLVTVAVAAGRDRVEVDAGRVDRRPRLGAGHLRVVAGQVAPAPHQRGPRQAGRAGRTSTLRV